MKFVPFCAGSLLALLLPNITQAQSLRGQPFSELTKPLPHRIFVNSRMEVDRMLARPYDSEVPFGASGDRVWATSPQGWAFREGVNLLYFTNSNLFDLTVNGGGVNYEVGKAFYSPSHVHMVGKPETGDKLTATASFTYTIDHVNGPLTKPFVPEKRWTCWSSGRREDWYAVNLGRPRNVTGVDLYFYDDQPVGGVAPPVSVQVEAYRDGGWHPVAITPFSPKAGQNTVPFTQSQHAEQIRFTFQHRGTDKYTGLYGVDPHFGPDPPASRPRINAPLHIEGDKWITQDDVLVSRLIVTNPTRQTLPFFVRMDSPLSGAQQGYADERSVQGFPLYLRGGGTDGKTHAQSFLTEIKPGERRVFTFACSVAKSPKLAEGLLNKALSDPYALQTQETEYQSWFDTNTAYFTCSDPRVGLMYAHRWYNVKKNSMNPQLGKMQHRTFAEGRWTADWYANVISYGAGHQIRESRWLRDPSFAWGHVQTWTDNPRPDGIFPSHITPKGQQGGQYTDWITSTAWDAYLVHPDKRLLESVADTLARNAEAWKTVYGLDNSPLLVVDSHWWTGMEWQPSFFSFAGYETGGGAGTDPKKMTPLRRVDLTAYNFGNAQAVANIYRELGEAEKADRLQKLADETRNAMLAQMWDEKTHWFHSLRASDNAVSPTKEIIGLYPFYFDLPPRDKGYEAAWSVALDPKEFWTAWPLASVSKDCPAYAQNGWPVGPGGSGCMWNGPTWPHANSLVMSAMANMLRHYAPCAVTRSRLLDLFTSFTLAQFKGQDLQYPWTGEYYNGDTGEWKTSQRDYNHSTWIDPLIRDLIGIVPRPDNILEVDSLLPEKSWSYYVLDGQAYRGHDVTIAWDEKGGHVAPNFQGYTVYLDGKQILHADRPAHVLYDMVNKRIVTGK